MNPRTDILYEDERYKVFIKLDVRGKRRHTGGVKVVIAIDKVTGGPADYTSLPSDAREAIRNG